MSETATGSATDTATGTGSGTGSATFTDTATATSTAPDGSIQTSIITSTSISLTTSPTTTYTVTASTPETSSNIETTPTPIPTSISSVSIPPSTTVVETTPTPTSSPSVVAVTATVTETPSSTGGTQSPSVVIVTSTYSPDPTTSQSSTASSASRHSSSSSTPSALSASGSSSGSSHHGLGSGAKTAIAVIIPIVVIAAAFLAGFFFWRKRKARKDAEELRKNEMAEYGFNPNSDPTLAAGVGAYTDNQSEPHDDNSGYRGWGATSSNRKASTTLGSNGLAAGGPALSESSSQPGGYAYQTSPNGASDHYSADPLMNGHPEGGDGVAALGAAGAAGGLSRSRSGAADIRRGPSNASSAYSVGHQSEASSDTHNMPGPYYQEEVPYNIYNDAAASHGPYGDGSYGGDGTYAGNGGQPVIRDVQARRNTRIERAPTFPQTQGGIAQNF